MVPDIASQSQVIVTSTQWTFGNDGDFVTVQQSPSWAQTGDGPAPAATTHSATAMIPSLPVDSTKFFNFNQLDSIDFLLVPYQHSADNVIVEYSLYYRIPR